MEPGPPDSRFQVPSSCQGAGGGRFSIHFGSRKRLLAGRGWGRSGSEHRAAHIGWGRSGSEHRRAHISVRPRRSTKHIIKYTLLTINFKFEVLQLSSLLPPPPRLRPTNNQACIRKVCPLRCLNIGHTCRTCPQSNCVVLSRGRPRFTTPLPPPVPETKPNDGTCSA